MGLLFECVGSYLKTLELSWLCADLQVSAELADSHRIKILATQCFGGADLSAQKLQMGLRIYMISLNLRRTY